MPKRKTFDGRKQREKQKMRMREKRQQSRYPDTPPNELVVESSVSVEPVDGAISAPPSNFLGQVSMGFPHSKKPLARVQASLRERMHSPASRLPSPRGSRLFVREQDKAPSPDSPAWVCAPPRAPGLDTVHVSGPAGQAQLDTSREEETSSILKDEETLTRNKTDTERKTKRILNEHKILETIYENQNNDISEEIYDEISKNIYDEISESIIENQCIKISENMYDSHNEISKNLNENEESEVTENMNEKHVTAIHVNLYENQQTRTMKDINGKIENENDLEVNKNAGRGRKRQRNVIASQRNNMLGNFNDNEFACGKNLIVKANFPSNENFNFVSKKIIQGTFHQGDIMFGENAGTQCVANCLASISYHKMKNTVYWTSEDMDQILITGNELYTFLQRSSSINNTYLLVEELPQLFECFDMSYVFKADEPLTSVILPSDELNYADFHALPLNEALEISLGETDGCFVCYGGNSFLIGKFEHGFFLFDSHSRSVNGIVNENGKSTRILLADLGQVYMHVHSLAISMGYSSNVICNLTGVYCKTAVMTDTDSNFESLVRTVDAERESKGNNKMLKNDDFMILSHEIERFMFLPLNEDVKRNLCEQLNVPLMCIENEHIPQVVEKELTSPATEKEIIGDGNCFFRAVSYSVSNSEDFHSSIRSAVCGHMMTNQELFKTFLRNGEGSIESHLSASLMRQEGTWATEVEILAMAHFLRVDIFTYSGGQWLKFSGDMVTKCLNKRRGAIYLHHLHQNHYNVVISMHVNLERNETVLMHEKIEEHFMQRRNIGKSSSRLTSYEKQKNIKREKYNQNPVLRNRKLAAAALKYREDKYYQSFVKERYKEKYRSDTKCRERSKKLYDKNRDVKREISTEKYRRNTSHREDVKLRSKEKYRTDPVHKEEMKKRSTVKYQTNAKHREEMKKRSIIKYQSDEKHREEMKKRSIIKYQSDEKHRENVKIRSKQIYNSDEAHKKRVNSASIRKYNTDESYRKRNLRKRSMKYETDDGFRTRAKVYSKEMYASSSNVRLKKRDALIQQRRAKRQKLDNEEEVAALFRCKVKEGINYICCCCTRLLFENQVQRCNPPSYEKNTEAASAAEVCIQTKYLHQCSEFCLPNCTRSSLWICFTCHRKILKGKIPAEATVNNLILEDIPKELSDLNSLERHLIALQIPFMKVMGLPHGGQKNVHGPVVCVPSDMKKVANLPLKEDENLLLRVKLKRKLNYKGYFEYQFVDPKHVFAALDYLKQNNKWYASVTIDKNWKENDFGEEVTEVTDEVQLDDVEHQELATDTCLQPLDIAQEVLDHFFDDIYSIAPGEGKNPVRMLQEPGNEAKSFPYLFPSGKFSWNDDRPERITLSRYFNNRLMNADNRFAKDTSYIFFSQYLSELNQVIEKTQISIRKSVTKIGSDKLVTPAMLQDPETLSKLLRNDVALRFMQPIRGTPAYWSAAQKDLFAMLRQLGIPTWFCSFSAAEHRWNDSIRTILQQQNDHRDPDLLDWSEKKRSTKK
nr:uncharacterized protein LOC117687529 [Crassostrea gigas]